nr:MAG TPA: hypothetical protein [Bacteriophage sp.]
MANKERWRFVLSAYLTSLCFSSSSYSSFLPCVSRRYLIFSLLWRLINFCGSPIVHLKTPSSQA